jgi:hypothetical protein
LILKSRKGVHILFRYNLCDIHIELHLLHNRISKLWYLLRYHLKYHNLWYSTNIKSDIECDIQIWYPYFFGYLPNTCVHHTMNTLGALTLIKLFVKMLEIFEKFCFSKNKVLWSKINNHLEFKRTFYIFIWNLQISFNYFRDMCWSYPCTMVLMLEGWSLKSGIVASYMVSQDSDEFLVSPLLWSVSILKIRNTWDLFGPTLKHWHQDINKC